MIPAEFHSLWKKGLEPIILFKTLWLGGGGYMLGFTKDFEATQKALMAIVLRWFITSKPIKKKFKLHQFLTYNL